MASQVPEKKKMSLGKKVLIAIGILIGIGIIANLGKDDTTDTKVAGASTTTQNAVAETPKEKSVPTIGETLSTEYFDVTISKFSIVNSVNTGNEFANLKAEDGIKYLVLSTTFKNTDSESRMITDGEVYITYKGKEYNFDKSETVMLEGYGLMLDQINPLTSKTTKLIYKIPTEITGDAYYHPGRSDDEDRIYIGKIQ